MMVCRDVPNYNDIIIIVIKLVRSDNNRFENHPDRYNKQKKKKQQYFSVYFIG